MRLKITTPLLLSAFLLVSCGKDKDKDSKSSGGGDGGDRVQNEAVSPDGSNIQGFYATTLLPVNNNMHLLKVGSAALQREGDTFSAFVKMKYGQRQTTIRQGIYTGTRCPDYFKDDINKDAYVDIKEALPIIGKMIVPLDGNLDFQTDVGNGYPAGDNMLGGYFYKTTGSFQRMFADLKAPDMDPDDNLVKLKADEGLALAGRIVVLQGINERVFLPPTAETIGDQSPYKTMVVACGVLKKVGQLPEELNGAPTGGVAGNH